LGWGSKFMERFGNSALHFPLSRRSDNADGLSLQSVAKTDLSTIPSIEVPQCGTKLEASATVEADTCRKYVVPICLGGGGSLFCGLKTSQPRRSRAKAGAFSLRLNAPQRRQPIPNTPEPEMSFF
jgi:hypothetical protein